MKQSALKSLFWPSLVALAFQGGPIEAANTRSAQGKTSPAPMSLYQPVPQAWATAMQNFVKNLSADNKAKLNPTVQGIAGDSSFDPSNPEHRLLLAPALQNMVRGQDPKGVFADVQKALDAINQNTQVEQAKILSEAQEITAKVEALKQKGEIKPNQIKRMSGLLSRLNRVQLFSTYLAGQDSIGKSLKEADGFLRKAIFDLSAKKIDKFKSENLPAGEDIPVEAGLAKQISFYEKHLEGQDEAAQLAVVGLGSLAGKETDEQAHKRIAVTLVRKLQSNPKGKTAGQTGQTLEKIGLDSPHGMVKQIIVKGLMNSGNPNDLPRAERVTQETQNKSFIKWTVVELTKVRDSAADTEKAAIQSSIDRLNQEIDKIDGKAVVPAPAAQNAAATPPPNDASANPADKTAADSQKAPGRWARFRAFMGHPMVQVALLIALMLGLALAARLFPARQAAAPTVKTQALPLDKIKNPDERKRTEEYRNQVEEQLKELGKD